MIFQAAPLPPPRDLASAKRNFPFLWENLKRHDVSVVSFGTLEQERVFREMIGARCADVRFVRNYRPRLINGILYLFSLAAGQSPFRALVYRRAMQRAIDELVQLQRFDVIHSCGQLFGVYRFPRGIPLVSDTHNVEYDIIRRTYEHSLRGIRKLLLRWDHFLSRKFELNMCNRFDLLLATTERDRQLFLQDLPGTGVVVIQNGVDRSFFEYKQEARIPRTMVFVGLFTFYPNVDAIRYFLDRMFPAILDLVPEAKVTIVGGSPPRDILDRGNANIEVTGWVDDVRPYLARSSVFVIPLRIGSGIRGKALEAMAMKCPIVSTTLGCAGIDLHNGVSALFADTPQDFAAATARLLLEPSEGQRLAENAYAIVTQKHNWEAKGEELQLAYHQVLSNMQPAPVGRTA
jgi:glycosyltransferase involved in cell wall biosynthesis